MKTNSNLWISIVATFAYSGFVGCNKPTPVKGLSEARTKLENNPSDKFYLEKAQRIINESGGGSWDAIANLERAIEINSSEPSYYHDIAFCYGKLKQYDSAIKYYSVSIDKGIDYSSAWYNRAICNFKTNNSRDVCLDLGEARKRGWERDELNLRAKTGCMLSITKPDDYFWELNGYKKSMFDSDSYFQDIDNDGLKDLVCIVAKDSGSYEMEHYLCVILSQSFSKNGEYQLKKLFPFDNYGVNLQRDSIFVYTSSMNYSESFDLVLNPQRNKYTEMNNEVLSYDEKTKKRPLLTFKLK